MKKNTPETLLEGPNDATGSTSQRMDDLPPPYEFHDSKNTKQPESSYAQKDFVPPAKNIVVPPTVVTRNVVFGPKPQHLICPHCQAEIITAVESRPNSSTHWWALCLCCLIGLLGVWIPYCVDSCQSQVHSCPNCKEFLGIFENNK